MKSAHYQKIFNSRRKAYPGGAAAYPDEYITDHEKPLFRPSHPKSPQKAAQNYFFGKSSPKKEEKCGFKMSKKMGVHTL
ncbi:MAG: hypothetical protein QGH39_06665 [Candidatus Thermoplasmatota archaeon]|jgi:hypothetical protein|nr:hypothetical protein [Candidatus Thermoplasmatota archaeon]MDP7265225.1 hypothetical protein [Candidatus Thermoplasmatota archaeon]